MFIQPRPSKSALRQHFRQLRSQIPADYRAHAALAAAKILTEQTVFQSSTMIACYLPVKDEFDTLPMIEAIWRAKKHCYLPVLTEEKSLQFVQYDYGDVLHPNRYSILEPLDQSRRVPPEQLDIMLLPLLAFDRAGTRLGMGGGYYDRTLAFLQERGGEKPKLIGVAYAVQEAKWLPSEPWDVGLEGVVTDRGFYLFSI